MEHAFSALRGINTLRLDKSTVKCYQFVCSTLFNTMADIGRTRTKYLYNLSVTRYTFAWYRKIVHVVRVHSFCSTIFL